MRHAGKTVTGPRRTPPVVLVVMALAILGIGTLHALDARRKGESLWPVFLGLAMVAAAVAGVVGFVRRPIDGLTPAEATRVRARQVVKWAAPIAVIVAILVAIAQAWISGR